MKCRRCGSEIKDWQSFCQNCGYIVSRQKKKLLERIVPVLLVVGGIAVAAAGWLGVL